MIFAISNQLTGLIAGNDANAGVDANNMLSWAFDDKYISGGFNPKFDFIGVTGDNYTYVGIAGHNLGTIGATITITNHDVNDVVAFNPLDDRVLMFSVPARSGGINDLKITIIKPADAVVIINHVAAGVTTDFTAVTPKGQVVANDYGSGFALVPMVIPKKIKTTVNDLGAPVATLTKSIALKVKLDFKHMPRDFARSNLLAHQKYWVSNGFFCQNDNDPEQSYLAFDFVPTVPKAHGSTRELVSVSYQFLTYTGL